jgi:hypothetical protein
MGVTLMRDEGESKDCERWMRILGEGVRGGGAIRAAMRAAMLDRVYVAKKWTCKCKEESEVEYYTSDAAQGRKQRQQHPNAKLMVAQGEKKGERRR